MGFPSFASGDVLTATDMNAVGLWLIKTQTVGTAVSSVTVTSAFSSTYDAYKIVYVGGSSSADGDIKLTLGSTTANYYMILGYAGWGATTLTVAGTNNGNGFNNVGSARTTTNSCVVEIFNPFASDETTMGGFFYGGKSNSVGGFFSGFLNDTTSYTSFTLAPSSGTFTGGTIYVYGFKK